MNIGCRTILVCYGLMMFPFLSVYYGGFATMNKLWFSRSRTWFGMVKCPQLSLSFFLG